MHGKKIGKTPFLWSAFLAVAMGGLSAQAIRPPLPGEQGMPGEYGKSLTINSALELAEKYNQPLQSDAWEYHLRDAESRQAGAWKNPELEAGLENFAGSGGYAGIQGMETTVGIRQEIELGSKRSKRRKAGEAHRDVSAWNYETQRRELRSTVVSRYAEVLALQEKWNLLQKSYALQEKLLQHSVKRHQAGKAPATEEMKARIQLALTHMEIDRASRELHTVRLRLASLWNDKDPEFDSVSGSLSIERRIPDLQEALNGLEKSPLLQAVRMEKQYLERARVLETSEKIPNLGVGLGGKYDAGSGDNAFIASLDIPLPFWNRNSHGVKAADMRIQKLRKQEEGARVEWISEVKILVDALGSLAETLEHFEEEILPEAEKAEQAVMEGYQMGRLGQLELMDSQRLLLESRKEYIDSRLEFAIHLARLEKLSGLALIQF